MIKATIKDIGRVTDVLTDSFKENKSIINVTRKGKNQSLRIRKLMKFFTLNTFYNGDVFISDDANGCLLMLTKDEERKGTITKRLHLLIWKVNLMFNILGINNVINVLQREKAINKNHPKGNYLHLYYVGVYKEFQGKRIGSKLIEEVIQYYGVTKTLYLETSDIRNLPFYKKLGFRVVNIHNELEITLYILKKESLS
ncbi:Acetyltransferase (GNAT) domain-containing protein [Tenacibaculum sp. MAR_2009_124]|uniref:GNAT family N-acetyltransferase n=1 Tax=Tenacibaculum sp. MAR_2009_124 TaxID=1250059 RepID=UPI0008961B25|nr:GNAT family N-acetyltransferase [Tenacibaculum sp. MAR_2009_124]SEB41390.1 Acetyltransferase (GNAT) domain-containing protein [Tenacibaculum sp. MAR_2009_124]